MDYATNYTIRRIIFDLAKNNNNVIYKEDKEPEISRFHFENLYQKIRTLLFTERNRKTTILLLINQFKYINSFEQDPGCKKTFSNIFALLSKINPRVKIFIIEKQSHRKNQKKDGKQAILRTIH